MAVNYTNDQVELISTKKVIPTATYSTGTVTKTTNAQVDNSFLTFAGGASTANMKVGGWIFIDALNEVRKIVRIADDNTTVVFIDRDFSGAVAASAYTYSPPSRFKEISWLVQSTGSATINGVSVPANSYGAFGKNSLPRTEQQFFVDPVIFDGTVTNIIVTTLS